jgi:hypothetical protein
MAEVIVTPKVIRETYITVDDFCYGYKIPLGLLQERIAACLRSIGELEKINGEYIFNKRQIQFILAFIVPAHPKPGTLPLDELSATMAEKLGIDDATMERLISELIDVFRREVGPISEYTFGEIWTKGVTKKQQEFCINFFRKNC